VALVAKTQLVRELTIHCPDAFKIDPVTQVWQTVEEVTILQFVSEDSMQDPELLGKYPETHV
jgi:hypothetical protein